VNQKGDTNFYHNFIKHGPILKILWWR